MIETEIRKVLSQGVEVTVSIPGGEQLAKDTFNSRLGIEGGLSILGTTGIVRPYCTAAAKRTIDLALDVATAQNIRTLIMVPGNIGARSAAKHFPLAESQTIEVGNLWGYAVDKVRDTDCRSLLVVGHPGKLVKLARNQWNTHSRVSRPVASHISREARRLLGIELGEVNTAQGLFEQLPVGDRRRLADYLAQKIAQAIHERLDKRPRVTPMDIRIALILMDGTLIGGWGGPES